MPTFNASMTKGMLILIMLISAGCSLPESKDSKRSSATFSIESVKGTVLESETTDPFGLSDKKVFSFKVCLKDVNEKKAVGGQSFKVTEVATDVSTDVAGCVNWTENLNYNAVADSKYVKIQRTILATGLHRGERVVNLGINPWTHGESIAAVIDLDSSKVPNLIEEKKEVQQSLRGLDKSDKEAKRTLLFEDGRIFITEDQLTKDGKINLRVDLPRLNPTIMVKKTNGDPYPRPLTRGTFKVHAMIIHSVMKGDQESRRILGEGQDAVAKMANGSLGINFVVPLVAIPDRGQIFLGLRIDPVDGPESLMPFEGVFLLGEYHQLKLNSFLRLHTSVGKDPNFKLSTYVQKDAKDLAQNSGHYFDEDLYRMPRIEVNKLRLPPGRVGKESTSRREVIYRIEACLKHGLDDKHINSQTFNIKRFQADDQPPHGLPVIQRKTLHEGCLTWEEKIDIDVNECQHFIRGKINIQNDDLGMNQTIGVMINPWDTFASDIGRDMRWVDKNETITYSCEGLKTEDVRPRRQVKLEQMNLIKSSASYILDNALNLTYVKRYDFRMDAWSLYYNHLFGGREDGRQKLRDGIYLFRAAVTRNRDYDANHTFVSSAEKLVLVKNGQVNVNLEFRTKDLKAVGNSNTLMVDLSPVKESLLSPNPDADGNPAPLDPKANLSDLIDRDTQIDVPVFLGTIIFHTDETTRTLVPLNDGEMTKYLVRGYGDLNSKQSHLIPEAIAKGKAQMKADEAASALKNGPAYYAQLGNLELININAKTADPVRQKLGITTFAGTTDDRLIQGLPLSTDVLQTILNNGNLSPDVAAKLCTFWINDYFGKMHADKGGMVLRPYRHNLALDCMGRVQKNPAKMFKVDRLLSVKEIGNYVYKTGVNEGLTIGTSFSVGNTHSKAESTSHSIALKGGLSAKGMNVFSLGLDYAYQMSWNQSNQESAGNSISVGTTKSMSVGMNVFDITFNKYQLCAVVRLNPDMFLTDDTIYPIKSINYAAFLNPHLTDKERGAGAMRGLMLCEEKTRVTPITKKETYYVLSQEGYVQMQDTNDPRNRNFFAALRSDNDYYRFVTATKGKADIPLTAKAALDITGPATQTLMGIFHAPPPSTPGMYLLHD